MEESFASLLVFLEKSAFFDVLMMFPLGLTVCAVGLIVARCLVVFARNLEFLVLLALGLMDLKRRAFLSVSWVSLVSWSTCD